MRSVVAALLLLAAWSAAQADERILGYDTDIGIHADGSLEVTEQITVSVEGQQIRHGIYRDFPTRYRDRYGNRVVVAMEVLGVERDGNPEPWWQEQRHGNGVRIYTGNDTLLSAPAQHTFTIRYRTTRQLGFFADHDELYWNAIGGGWGFPIDSGSVQVHLPTAVPVTQMKAEGYTGWQGARGQDYQASLPQDGTARWNLTRPLQPYENFTIVLSFPKGIVTQPAAAQRAGWFFRDNRGVLIALGGFAMLLLFCMYEWRRVGRDPAQGIIIARYEPPQGQTPANLRYLAKMRYDTRCFSAAVLRLAVAGYLRIVKESRLLKDEWRLERVLPESPPAATDEGMLLGRLFKDGSQSLVLKEKNATTLSSAMTAQSRSLSKSMKPRYFSLNGWSSAKAWLIAIPVFMIALVMSEGAGIIAIMGLAILAVVIMVVFAFAVRAPTVEGRRLLDEIEGLKLYLSVAERDELARMQEPGAPPQLDAKRYESLLPYAVALEVEEAWTRKFTLAVGAAAAAVAANNIGWYQGGNVGDLSGLTAAVGSSLASQIAASSSPPGSSSGAGGGGSAGGGGGGGGGGGH